MAFSYIPTYLKKQEIIILLFIACLIQCLLWAMGYILESGPLMIIYYLTSLVGGIFTVYVLARLFGPLPEGSLVCSSQNNMGQNNMGQNNMGQNNTRQNNTRQNNTRQNNTRQNNTRQNNMGQNNPRQPF